MPNEKDLFPSMLLPSILKERGAKAVVNVVIGATGRILR